MAPWCTTSATGPADCACAAGIAGTTSCWPSVASAAGSAPHAVLGACRRPPPTWWITSSRRWARLLKRVFDIDMQHCPNCGAGELKIIAAILERPVIEKIFAHLGLDLQPRPKGRAREAELHFAA